MSSISLPLLFSVLLLLSISLPSSSASCAFQNMFYGPTESCIEEYMAGQEPGASGCFRDADCFGFSCHSEYLGETELVGRYIPCNATMTASLIDLFGNPVATATMPVEEFEISYLGVSLKFDVLEKDAGYLKYNIDIVVFGIRYPIGPFSFGEPDCIWNKAHCSILYIYIGIGVGSGLILIGIIVCCCCCCCRKRRQVNQQYTMLEEPFISKEKGGTTEIN